MPAHTKSAKSKTQIAVIGIDIGKNVFHLIGLDRRGAIVLKCKLSRSQLENRLANTPACLIGMEACVGSHHLSRRLIALGHDARLMPAKYVKPFLKGHKNDYRDAEANAEAVQRPTMRFVATKTVEQLDLQALHRVRARLVRERTASVNYILAKHADFLLPRMIQIIEALVADWRRLDDRIEGISYEIGELAQKDAPCKRLMTIPGVGPLISSATVATIGGGDMFAKGRDFGAWLGMVPKQLSTGGRTILGRISKRGNTYLRTLFVQAARVVLLKRTCGERYGLKPWIERPHFVFCPDMHGGRLSLL